MRTDQKADGEVCDIYYCSSKWFDFGIEVWKHVSFVQYRPCSSFRDIADRSELSFATQPVRMGVVGTHAFAVQ